MGIGSSFKGFETAFAGLRMLWQMVVRLLFALVLLHMIIVSAFIYRNHESMYGKLDSRDFCLFRTYAGAKLAYNISDKKEQINIDYTCEGATMKIGYVYFISNLEPYILKRLRIIQQESLSLIGWTALIYLLLPLLMIYFSIKHKKDSQDKFIRGGTLVPASKLRELINSKSPTEYKFRISDNIEIPIGIITRHCICLGKPGTGKTQLISRIVEQIIRSGFRAIIHDFKGDFITTFYDYRKHYIFNPLDKRHMGLKDIEMELIEKCKGLRIGDLDKDIVNRYPKQMQGASENDKVIPLFEFNTLLDVITDIVAAILPESKHIGIKEDMHKLNTGLKGWSIFNELKSSIDIDAFCASLIPESASQDNFWPISSRQLLGSIISYCIYNNIVSYAELWKLVNLGNEQLLELFKDTPGCEEGVKLLTEAKTANNILAVMSNYTKPIKYLIGTEGDFSIKDWVKDTDSQRKIIFLSNYSMIQETIRPFLTLFADFSIKTLLSLDDDLNRRLFFILDEFGELGKIGTIVPLLTGSRSKGGAGFLLIQDTARINTIYGKDGCSTIVNACGNLISFAVKKEEADFASECFGSAEIKRTEESKSMGVDDISDSISISKQTLEKRLVMPSEVATVPTLNFYIQLTDYPVSRDKLDIVQFNRRAQSYIGREDLLFKPKTASADTSRVDSSTSSSNGTASIQPIEQKDTVTRPVVEDALFGEVKADLSAQEYFGMLVPEPQGVPGESEVLAAAEPETPIEEPRVDISEELKDDPEGMVF